MGGTSAPGPERHQFHAVLDQTLPQTGAAERFGIEEFYQRVANQEGTDVREARRHARAVVAALKASITGGEFDDLVAQLPAEYGDLLGTGPVQTEESRDATEGKTP